jgi:putative thioredoxin
MLHTLEAEPWDCYFWVWSLQTLGQDMSMTQPRDFSMYGAVDLGARQAAAQRRQQAAARASEARASDRPGQPGAGQASGAVIEVTEETFNTDVISRSRTTPVIVDLWAEWCGPCKQLSPILERLAAEANGAWVLAKVDVDANPQLAAAFQAQSIPMVVAVVGGQLVDAFLGAIPEAQVKQWIAQVLAAAQQLGVGTGQASTGQASTGQPGADQQGAGGAGLASQLPAELTQVQEAMDRGDFDAAAATLEKYLAQVPSDPTAKTWLAQVNLQRRVNSYDEAAARRAAAAAPDDVDAQIKVADLDLSDGRVTDAFDRLLGVVRRTSGDDRDRARVHLVSLFEIFSPRDPDVTKARGALSSLLF